jgi:glycyl-tRNA synthetase beta chain
MPERRDLLVEIGTEEMPPRQLPGLSIAFAEAVAAAFKDTGLSHGDIQRYATPRRLALLVQNLCDRQGDQTVERKGPPAVAAFDPEGAPTKAALGFAKSCGVGVESLQILKTDKGAWLYYRVTQPGQETRSLLPSLIATAVGKLPIPRRMRWGTGEAEFVRPVHWLIMLFGEEVLDAEILGIKAGRQTWGHRFHHPQPLTIVEPAEYAQRLEAEAKVLANFALRRARIREQAEQQAAALGGRPLIDEDLLDEVTGLVEWPRALAGSFDPSFLEIPPEVLITTMQDNQRYFPVVCKDGRLMPHFVAVSNIESKQPEEVRAGNERVIRPRFNDAAFFWRQDLKTPLESRREALKGIAFQEKLGSVFDKTERIERLVAFLAEECCADVTRAVRTAVLSKCDLVTDMVLEFPVLQGIMGSYYAAHDGEDELVAVALGEQYMPRYAGDELPHSRVGQVLAVADRMDTLLGIFALGERPTGERDPFGLRRAALGTLRIMIERELDVDLELTLRRAATGLSPYVDANAAVTEVFDYIVERLKSYYLDREIAPDVLNAVLAKRPTKLLDFDRRVRAVQVFRNLPEAQSLASANKRIANILRQTGGTALSPRIDERLLCDVAERELHDQLRALSCIVEPLFEAAKYEQALAELARLRQPVDRFFDEVLVMTEDQARKKNRLALLTRLSHLFLGAADLSRLQ